LRKVIRSFKDNATARLFADEDVSRFRGIERQARRKLLALNAAATLADLRSPPGNRLKELKGERKGQHAIRINDQWRICFVWRNGAPEDVEVVDYH
jgi:proteic killer suppression protein